MFRSLGTYGENHFLPESEAFIEGLRAGAGWHGGTELRYADRCFPFARTPSFLVKFQKEIENSPTAYDMLYRQTNHGPKVEWGIALEAGEEVALPFASGVNEYLQQFYRMKTLRIWDNICQSKPMLVWDLGNGYNLSAHCVDPVLEEMTPYGNYYLSLLWRHKNYSTRSADGARRLRKFVLKLAEMEGAPPRCFYKPAGVEKLKHQKHLKPLEMDWEGNHTTNDLIKIYNRILGGEIIPKTDDAFGCQYYQCGIYKPKNPMQLPDWWQQFN